MRFYKEANSELNLGGRRRKNVEIVLISCEEDMEDVATYAKRYGMSFLTPAGIEGSVGTLESVEEALNHTKKNHAVWAGQKDRGVFGAGTHQGIPTLVLVSPSVGRGVNYDARWDVVEGIQDFKVMDIVERWKTQLASFEKGN